MDVGTFGLDDMNYDGLHAEVILSYK